MYTLKKYLILIFKFCVFFQQYAIFELPGICCNKHYTTNRYLGCHVEERLHCSKNYEYIFNYLSICSSKEQQSYKQYII